MKYIDYYPPVLREIREIRIIGEAMDNELEYVKSEKDKTSREFFVCSAENMGLERLEKVLNINVSDKDDIELRRFNILAKLMRSKRYLIDVLNSLIGEKGYTLRYYADEQRLEAVLTLERKDYLNGVKELLEEFIPLNIELNITLAYNTHNILHKHKHNELSKFNNSELIIKEGL